MRSSLQSLHLQQRISSTIRVRKLQITAGDAGNDEKSTAWHRDKLSLLLALPNSFQMHAHQAREATGGAIAWGSAPLGWPQDMELLQETELWERSAKKIKLKKNTMEKKCITWLNFSFESRGKALSFSLLYLVFFFKKKSLPQQRISTPYWATSRNSWTPLLFSSKAGEW